MPETGTGVSLFSIVCLYKAGKNHQARSLYAIGVLLTSAVRKHKVGLTFQVQNTPI